MKLADLQRSGTKTTVYSGVLADAEGNREYELSITGTRAMVDAAFKGVEFDVVIDKRVAREQFEARSREFWNSRVRGREVTGKRRPASVDSVSRKAPKPATAKDSVVVSLRRTSGDGTLWAAWFPGLVLPAGMNLFFVLPRVWTCWGVVVPAVGDADIFLSLGSPAAPVVMAATAGGTTAESVMFTGTPLPWTHFSAWFRVNGFVNTATDFGMVGHSIP
jgi:hypothetical protein